MSLEKKSLLDNRYQLLATSSIYTYDDENLTSYAEFLRFIYRYDINLKKNSHLNNSTISIIKLENLEDTLGKMGM